MGKPRKSHKGVKKEASAPREVAPDVHRDKQASNLLSFSRPQYQGVSKGNKSRNRLVDRAKVGTKKKERVYTEKELGIPKLNTALDPVGVKVRGKKGKKFVDDSSMQIILAEVLQKSNESNASKLEKARQLEAIREAKRREIEEKEQQSKQKLEDKKRELKSRKPKSLSEPTKASTSKTAKPARKRVSFAV